MSVRLLTPEEERAEANKLEESKEPQKKVADTPAPTQVKQIAFLPETESEVVISTALAELIPYFQRWNTYSKALAKERDSLTIMLNNVDSVGSLALTKILGTDENLSLPANMEKIHATLNVKNAMLILSWIELHNFYKDLKRIKNAA